MGEEKEDEEESHHVVKNETNLIPHFLQIPHLNLIWESMMTISTRTWSCRSPSDP